MNRDSYKKQRLQVMEKMQGPKSPIHRKIHLTEFIKQCIKIAH